MKTMIIGGIITVGSLLLGLSTFFISAMSITGYAVGLVVFFVGCAIEERRPDHE